MFISYFDTKNHDAYQRREKNEKQVKHIEKMAYESKWKKDADHLALIDKNYEQRKQEKKHNRERNLRLLKLNKRLN